MRDDEKKLIDLNAFIYLQYRNDKLIMQRLIIMLNACEGSVKINPWSNVKAYQIDLRFDMLKN